MRIITSIAAFLLMPIVFTGALTCEQAAQESATKDAIGFSESDHASKLAMSDGVEVSLPPKPAVEHGWLYVPGDVCYTMHSLIVAREERDSDSTRVVDSRTCTLSSRFQVKRTAPPKDLRVDQKAVAHE